MAFDILSFAMGKAAGGGGAEEVETSVALDFSAGDMEVTPNDGEAFSKVTIPQPETLVAGNIAEGVTVAGIIGTLAGGGGGGTFVAKKGTFTATGDSYTLSHNLGAVPAFIWVFPTVGLGSNVKVSNAFGFAAGVSSKITDITGSTTDAQYGIWWHSYSSSWSQGAPDYTIDDTRTTSCYFNNANESTITIGTSSYKTVSGVSYTYLVAGLTE